MPSKDARSERVHIVGSVPFLSTDADTAAHATCERAITQVNGHHVHLLNAYSIALANNDQEYRNAIADGAINLPDGLPVCWVSRLRRDRQPLTQVRGVAFFLRTFEIGQSYGIKHFLLGSTPETLLALERNLLHLYPEAKIAGSISPPFRALTSKEVEDQDEAILRSGAHIVWVGLGTPKQDFEAARLAASIPVTAAAVGAAFDFVAGTVKEAPPFISKLGFEWLYRLVKEPRRLWRRYIFGNARFLSVAFRR